MATSVLYVGRSQRTVSARLRAALVARDGHCVFPGCRARPARCHAHHVTPWEHGGATDLDNLASQRVIQANGGRLQDRFLRPPAFGGTPAMRWRIALPALHHPA